MMCEVQLNGLEELTIGFARELRPALTLGYAPLPFDGCHHRSQPLPPADALAPRRVVSG